MNNNNNLDNKLIKDNKVKKFFNSKDQEVTGDIDIDTTIV